MYKSNIHLFLAILILVISLVASPATVAARPIALGISPTLNYLSDFSVLGGAAVTNTGPTTTTGAVGVSPGTSITGFSSSDGGPGEAGGGTHQNDDIAINAQAEALSVFGALDQACDVDWSGEGVVELGGESLVPGVYCADAFELTGTLTLTGGGEEVYIFKTASTLITASGSSVSGGDPCNVWWRVASNATLGTDSSFMGNVVSAGEGTSAITTGASLGGRFIGLSSVTITLDNNAIADPICVAQEVPTPTVGPTSTASPASTPEPETLPDTGGDLSGPDTQIIRFSLGTASLALILFGAVLIRKTQKAGR